MKENKPLPKSQNERVHLCVFEYERILLLINRHKQYWTKALVMHSPFSGFIHKSNKY